MQFADPLRLSGGGKLPRPLNAFRRALQIEPLDLAVELTSLDKESGHATVDARDASVGLAKRNGEWVITTAEAKESPAIR